MNEDYKRSFIKIAKANNLQTKDIYLNDTKLNSIFYNGTNALTFKKYVKNGWITNKELK